MWMSEVALRRVRAIVEEVGIRGGIAVVRFTSESCDRCEKSPSFSGYISFDVENAILWHNIQETHTKRYRVPGRCRKLH